MNNENMDVNDGMDAWMNEGMNKIRENVFFLFW